MSDLEEPLCYGDWMDGKRHYNLVSSLLVP